VDSVPDPLFLRKSGSAGNRTWTSGSVAKNSDYQTTEAVAYDIRLQLYLMICMGVKSGLLLRNVEPKEKSCVRTFCIH
jgi:hypothetical protein